ADARWRGTNAGLATSSLGATELIVCAVRAEPGRTGVPHKHDREEIVVVIDGSGTATLDGEDHEIAAGDTVIIPAGVVHAFTSGSDGYFCITCEPAGIRFFDPDGNEADVPWLMR